MAPAPRQRARAAEPSPRPLPPLQALQTFVIAGRTLSFKDTGRQLGLTASAVSRRIKALERHLGVGLFRRINRGLILTAAGNAYLAKLGPAFDTIATASSAVRGAKRRKLRLSLLQSFTSNWLIPHLADFYARHPDIELEIETSIDNVDFDREPVDAAIRFGDGRWPGLEATRLLEAEAYPVCHPRLLAGPSALRRPADLAQHILLQERHVPEFWPLWLAAAKVPGLEPRGRMDFDNFQLLFQAAISGIGIAWGIDILLEPYLDDGRLVAPFAERIIQARSYYLVHRPRDRDDPAMKQFKRWVLQTIRG